MIQKSIICVIVVLFFANVYSKAQLNYSAITGANKNGEIDTLAYQQSFKISNNNDGILEKEIDPDKYIVGANDKFVISIIANKPIEFETFVSPDAKMLIRNVGIVDIKDKTLNESYKIIKDKISEIYKTDNVNVVLAEIRKFKVTLSGNLKRPTTVSVSATERVSEAIEKAGGFTANSSLRNIEIYRKSKEERIKVDLIKFHYLGDDNNNPYLMGGDQIFIYALNENQTVEIRGEINNPNTFEFMEGDKLSDLIKFGQGFNNISLLDSVEFVRMNTTNNSYDSKIIDLSSWRNDLFNNKNLKGDFELNNGDRVYVRKKSNFSKTTYVAIDGLVKYPGRYPIDEKNDKLNEVIEKAGGFLEDASLNDISLFRFSIRKWDPELYRLSMMRTSEMSKSETKYFQSRIRERQGVMSLNFEDIFKNPNSQDNIVLKDKDSIYIPKVKDYINVQGAINRPGAVIYNSKYKVKDYVLLAGGLSYNADESEIFITRTGGEQIEADDNFLIQPGDVILVPPKPDSISFKDVLTIATQIITIAGVLITLVNLTNK